MKINKETLRGEILKYCGEHPHCSNDHVEIHRHLKGQFPSLAVEDVESGMTFLARGGMINVETYIVEGERILNGTITCRGGKLHRWRDE